MSPYSRGVGHSFHIHPAGDEPESLRAAAARDGLEVLASQLRDHAAIRELVAARERDTGGEG